MSVGANGQQIEAMLTATVGIWGSTTDGTIPKSMKWWMSHSPYPFCRYCTWTGLSRIPAVRSKHWVHISWCGITNGTIGHYQAMGSTGHQLSVGHRHPFWAPGILTEHTGHQAPPVTTAQWAVGTTGCHWPVGTPRMVWEEVETREFGGKKRGG